MADNLGNFFVAGDGSFKDLTKTVTSYTPIGTPTIDTSNKKFGNGSVRLNPTSHVEYSSTDALTFGTGDFTVDAWLYLDTAVNEGVSVDIRGIVQNGRANVAGHAAWILDFGHYVGWGPGTRINFNHFNDTSMGSHVSDAIPPEDCQAGQWHHVAVTRSSGTIYYFFNGTLISSAPHTQDINIKGGDGIYLGTEFSGGVYRYRFSGNLDNVRAIKGTALWTNDFSTAEQDMFYGQYGRELASNIYDIATVKGNLRGKAKAGYIRPTITELFTCNRPYPNLKNVPDGAGGNTVTTYEHEGSTYKVHTFTTSDTFSLTRGGELDILVVAGGGYGGHWYYAGGGGAGGFVYYKGKELLPGDYGITVGLGGATDRQNGGNSEFAGLVTAIGGGAGGNGDDTSEDATGKLGGSGGGSAYIGASYRTGGSGTLNQGNSGGHNHGGAGGGGGGGAKTAGRESDSISAVETGGPGGDGYKEGTDTVYNFTDGSQTLFEINGLGTGYAGGGGGGAWASLLKEPGPGGYGGGGDGGSSNSASPERYISAQDGQDGTGGGGGGAAHNVNATSAYIGKGGSGIVIVRYKIN